MLYDSIIQTDDTGDVIPCRPLPWSFDCTRIKSFLMQ